MKFDRRIPIALFMVIVLPPSPAGDWLQWGGPTRDFKSPETGLLEVWPKQGLPPKWVVSYPGSYASIVVKGDALYTLFTQGERKEVLRCLSTADGSLRWQHGAVSPDPPKKVMLNFGRGPNATPLIHRNKIVSVSFLGRLYCLNAGNGTVVWSRDLVSEFGAKIHMFGYSISPITYKNQVIVATGGQTSGLVALDWDTGRVDWKSEPVDVSYASPILIKVDGQEQLVMVASTEIVGLDPERGSVLWRYPHANVNKNNCADPLWGNDGLLFLSSHDDGGARVLEFLPGTQGTGVRQLWHQSQIRFFHTASVRLGDTIYGSSGTWSPTMLVAVDVHTGRIAWKERGFNKAHCVFADGKVIILDEDGTLSLAEVTPKALRVISSFKPLEKTAWAPPTIANGHLYLRDQKKVVAFDIRRKP